jgi:hypothetical protein
MWIDIFINELHIKNIFRPIQLYSVNTRNKHHLHRQTTNLSCFQKRAYYAGINIFNSLPSSLKSFMNDKAQFWVAQKKIPKYTLFLVRWWIPIVSKWLIMYSKVCTNSVSGNCVSIWRTGIRYMNPPQILYFIFFMWKLHLYRTRMFCVLLTYSTLYGLDPCNVM